MGVPSFYRWLVGRYPKIVVNAIDEGQDCAPDDPNPNGEFDNLYLDMNGIIHPCFHPDDELFQPSTFDDVFVAIFEYIDRLIRIVRPRKLLYLAVDGVAPRAKMNQQRARRYRVAKDAEIAEIEEKRLRREFESEGKELLPKQEGLEVSDSNVITPGTVFMHKLSKALEYYIRLRLNNDPFWKSIMVILSDSNVPGEGEHKFMSFIRLQRRLPCYNPNTRHCVYGLDADLIMLALATHEIHFCVLREEVLKQEQVEICLSEFVASSSQRDLETFKSREWFKKAETVSNRRINKTPYQFLNIWILREYLELDMKPRFDADIERIVDDFIFICFFAGNDFLPHLPSIEIQENGLDLLLVVYKNMFKSMGDYLTNISNIKKKNAAYINFKVFKMFIMEVGSYENKIFEKRYTLRQKRLLRLLQDREKDKNDGIMSYNSDFNIMQDNFSYSIGGSDSFSKKCNISSSASVETSCSVKSDAIENTRELKRKLKQFLRDKGDLFKNEVLDNDKVKLGCPGWKARYYKEKFSAETAKEYEAIRKELVKKYFEGLCWVLQYYFTGICSWSWYNPFYYAPFASDFRELCCTEVSFAIGMPFKPFDQLMAVLPPRSSHLPKSYMSLMKDENSPIINFYPKDFAVDFDGKRYTWQGVCKLPFIEEERLLEATKALLKELQPDEIERNCVSSDKIFAMDSNSLLKNISPQHQISENHPTITQNHDSAVPSFGMYCFSCSCEDSSAPSNFTSPVSGMENISNDRSSCATLIKPELEAHIPRPLVGVQSPVKTVTDADIVERILWHEYPGHYPPPQLCQRNVQIFPAPANETRKGAGEGWGGAGRGKLPVDRTLAGSSKEAWKGVGDGWTGVGRGKVIVYQTLAGPGPGRELRPSSSYVYPATHLDVKDRWSHVNSHGWGEHGAAPAASASSLKFDDSFRRMDERSSPANRSDDWRQKSAPMNSAYGRGRVTWVRPPSNSYGSRGGGARGGAGRGGGRGHQNSTWVPRKPECDDKKWQNSFEVLK